MGRPPSNGGPSFRFNPVEVGEMEAILQAHNYTVPTREILDALAQRFSNSAERSGKVEVSGKQVWNWFQNRRYALRAKAARTSVPGQVNMPVVSRDDQSVIRNVPQAPQPQVSQPPPALPNMVRSMPQVPQPLPVPSAQNASRNVSENPLMEFEAKSARDGAWYDVASFLSHRSIESGDPEAMVRFAGFGAEEDEWVNIRRHIRQRSLPCESSECVAVLPGDLILCFQEGKEQALYFDAHVLDAQRRRHDVRGCRCRFLVRYDHDQSEEIVPLRKICRRPETDHRLQQLHAMSVNMNQPSAMEVQAGNTLKLDAADSAIQKQLKQEERVAPSSTVTFAAPTTIPHTTETKLQTTSAAPTTIPHATESKLQTTSAAPNTIPHATESKLQTTSAAPTTIPHATESKLQTASAAPTTIPHATESKLQTTSAAPTTIPHATESKLQMTSAAPTTIPHTTESKLQTTSAALTTIPHVTESKLQPSKAVEAGNATAEANTVSSNTVTVSTAATGSALPTLPQG